MGKDKYTTDKQTKATIKKLEEALKILNNLNEEKSGKSMKDALSELDEGLEILNNAIGKNIPQKASPMKKVEMKDLEKLMKEISSPIDSKVKPSAYSKVKPSPNAQNRSLVGAHRMKTKTISKPKELEAQAKEIGKKAKKGSVIGSKIKAGLSFLASKKRSSKGQGR